MSDETCAMPTPVLMRLKSVKREVWALCIAIICVIALDVIQLGYAKWKMSQALSSINTMTEKQMNGIASSIECLDSAPNRDDHLEKRACVLQQLGRLQNPTTMLPLSLIAQDMLNMDPRDIRLRISAIFAISRTLHAYRHDYEQLQREIDHAQDACQSSLIGKVLLRCRHWFLTPEASPPNRIQSLLKLRYEFSRGHTYHDETLPAGRHFR